MQLVATLLDQHRRIERALASFDRFVRGSPTPEGLATYVRFFRGYVDRLHHGEEEDLLFAALLEEGSEAPDRMALLLEEHEQGRRAVEALAELAELPSLARGDLDLLRSTAAEYGALLRRHIGEEDGVVFPRAERTLPIAVADELDRQLERRGPPDPALLELADQLP